MCKRNLRGTLCGLGVICLILDSATALKGARDGLALCLGSVIPSIFPFLVLLGVLTPMLCGSLPRFLRPLAKLLRIPKGSEGIFLAGMIGGYPTGAQSVYHAWKRGQLSKTDAQRMLAFCSNAGPSFLFGILGSKFPEYRILWALWGIHILSAVIVALIMPGGSRKQSRLSTAPPVTLSKSLKNAVVTMGYICGWVVLFRILIAFLDRWILWLLPVNMRIAVYGILELANGCCSANLIIGDGMRFVLCSGMLAFGGLCVTMQTISVTVELGLGQYIPGKLAQALISMILSIAVQYLLFPSADQVAISPNFLTIIAVFALILPIILLKMKNRGSIPSSVGV